MRGRGRGKVRARKRASICRKLQYTVEEGG